MLNRIRRTFRKPLELLTGKLYDDKGQPISREFLDKWVEKNGIRNLGPMQFMTDEQYDHFKAVGEARDRRENIARMLAEHDRTMEVVQSGLTQIKFGTIVNDNGEISRGLEKMAGALGIELISQEKFDRMVNGDEPFKL